MQSAMDSGFIVYNKTASGNKVLFTYEIFPSNSDKPVPDGIRKSFQTGLQEFAKLLQHVLYLQPMQECGVFKLSKKNANLVENFVVQYGKTTAAPATTATTAATTETAAKVKDKVEKQPKRERERREKLDLSVDGVLIREFYQRHYTIDADVSGDRKVADLVQEYLAFLREKNQTTPISTLADSIENNSDNKRKNNRVSQLFNKIFRQVVLEEIKNKQLTDKIIEKGGKVTNRKGVTKLDIRNAQRTGLKFLSPLNN